MGQVSENPGTNQVALEITGGLSSLDQSQAESGVEKKGNEYAGKQGSPQQQPDGVRNGRHCAGLLMASYSGWPGF
jgi:hypothetical protein